MNFRFDRISDSGVELGRTENNKVLWRVHLEPIGVKHSKYSQTVRVHLAGSRLYVTIEGAKTIFESPDLGTGQQLHREVRAR